nr:Uncharacterised protein [Klebsiella pneumoniae]
MTKEYKKEATLGSLFVMQVYCLTCYAVFVRIR